MRDSSQLLFHCVCLQGKKTLSDLKAAVGPCVEAIEEAEKAGQGSVQQIAALEKAKSVNHTHTHTHTH